MPELQGGLRLYLDLHAHSNRRGAFLLADAGRDAEARLFGWALGRPEARAGFLGLSGDVQHRLRAVDLTLSLSLSLSPLALSLSLSLPPSRSLSLSLSPSLALSLSLSLSLRVPFQSFS